MDRRAPALGVAIGGRRSGVIGRRQRISSFYFLEGMAGRERASPAQKRSMLSIEDLPLNQDVLKQVLENNEIKDLEMSIYGKPKGKEEKMIYRKIKEAGMRVRMKEEENRRQVVIKLKRHLKFVILPIILAV